MIIEPRIIKNVCLTTHPEGCFANARQEIEWVKSQSALTMPKRVVVIGCSGGYGMASMNAALFAGGADVVGVSFEKEPSGKRTGSPGFYNNACVEIEAKKAGRKLRIINGDAFSDDVKEQTMQAIEEVLGGKVDLFVYSLASPVRTDPKTGETYRSVLKPLGETYKAQGIDFVAGKMEDVSIEPANDDEMRQTVKVMGGEDWILWINAMKKANVIAKDMMTVAYSYIGPEMTFAVYHQGTIGKAKEDLDRSAKEINEILKDLDGKAYVSVNKALVTRASSMIPVVPLYIAILFKVMKAKNLHEGCIEQIYRLYAERLYSTGNVPVDEDGRIRIDDWEMRDDIQAEVKKLWSTINDNNLHTETDLETFRHDYMRLHGFEVTGVDYSKDVDLAVLPQ